MPDLNWNDLRHVLAVARAGGIAAASRRLGVDETTVARRLGRAERALGARLFERVSGGALRPTASGAAAIARAERMELEVEGLRSAADGADADARGTVRMTAVPVLVNHLLLPAAPELAARHPGLRLELIAEPRNLSLGRREADVALRLARPDISAGKAILARRIGRLAYAAYARADLSPGSEAALPWITYAEEMAALPQSRWLAEALAATGATAAPVAVNDAEGVLQAVRRGLGKSLLPCAVADDDPGLHRIASLPVDLTREIWLLTHPAHRRLARVAAVISWLERTVPRLERSS